MQSLTSIFGNTRVQGYLEISNITLGHEVLVTNANTAEKYTFALGTVGANMYQGKFIVRVVYSNNETNVYKVEVFGSRLTAPTFNLNSIVSDTKALTNFFVAYPNSLSNEVIIGFTSNTDTKEISIIQLDSSFVQISDVSTSSYSDSDYTTLTLDASTTGNRTTATMDVLVKRAEKLNTARTISLSGDVSGSTTFDGTADKNISVTIGEGKVTNAMLANSSLTLGSTTVTLGSTYTTLAGLSSVSSTDFSGKLTGTKVLLNSTSTSGNGLFIRSGSDDTHVASQTVSATGYNLTLTSSASVPVMEWKFGATSGLKLENKSTGVEVSANKFIGKVDASDFTVTSLKSNIIPDGNETRDLGSSTYKYNNIYSKKFIGSLNGNADTATAIKLTSNTYPAVLYENEANTTLALDAPSLAQDEAQVLYVGNNGLFWAPEGSHIPGSANWRAIDYYATNVAASATPYKTGGADTGKAIYKPSLGLALSVTGSGTSTVLNFTTDTYLSATSRDVTWTPPSAIIGG